MANQYSDDKRGLGEYCPRLVIRLTEAQYKRIMADAAAANLPVAGYARKKLCLELAVEKQEESTQEAPKLTRRRNRQSTIK